MIFAFIFIRELKSKIFFFVCDDFGFGIRVILDPRNDLGTIPSSTLFFGDSRRTDVKSSLKILQNLTVKPNDLGLFFLGSFLITN